MLEYCFGGGKRRLAGNQDVAHQFVKRYTFSLRLGEVGVFDLRRKIERDGHGPLLFQLNAISVHSGAAIVTR